MRKEIICEIEIPKEVQVEIEENKFIVKGKEGNLSREFDTSNLIFEKKDNKIIIGNRKATKNDKRKINTIRAHIKNMIEGVQNRFEYKLKVCSSHFPITVKIVGNEVMVKNFLGEKIDRKMILPEGVEVKIDKEIITIYSCDKEKVGQISANFETLTKIRNKDRRIFQDGIFITNKAGGEI